MEILDSIPTAGQIVRVRQRHYLVEEQVAPINSGDANLLRLSRVDDDPQVQSLKVLWDANSAVVGIGLILAEAVLRRRI